MQKLPSVTKCFHLHSTDAFCKLAHTVPLLYLFYTEFGHHFRAVTWADRQLSSRTSETEKKLKLL